MEEKRKQDKYDAVSRTRKKAREDGNEGGQMEVVEEEVEEFFAILRRIHIAVKYFERGGNGDGRKLKERGSRLRQSIEQECTGGVNGVKSSKAREEVVEKNVGFDLNTDPVSEYSLT